MSKKLSIMAEFDFFQKVWSNAAHETGHREGIVVGVLIGPALDVMYQVSWGDGQTSDHFGAELVAKEPKEWKLIEDE